MFRVNLHIKLFYFIIFKMRLQLTLYFNNTIQQLLVSKTSN